MNLYTKKIETGSLTGIKTNLWLPKGEAGGVKNKLGVVRD